MTCQRFSKIIASVNWYLLRLPLTLTLISIGFLIDLLIGWPFALLCWLDARRHHR